METFESLVTMIDITMNSPRKRRIAGGILLSISFLFAGLACTIFILKTEETDNE